MERGTYGVRAEKVFDDWDGVKDVTSLPDAAPHRNVDKIVLAAGTEQGARIKTAIVCPPMIYGPGPGPDNQRSVQAYELAKGRICGRWYMCRISAMYICASLRRL